MNIRGKGWKTALRDDVNISRFKDLANTHLPKLPRASAKYLAAKAPIVQWIPSYSVSWLWNDLVAGKMVSLHFKPRYVFMELTRKRRHHWNSSSPSESSLCESRQHSYQLWPHLKLASDTVLCHYGHV